MHRFTSHSPAWVSHPPSGRRQRRRAGLSCVEIAPDTTQLRTQSASKGFRSVTEPATTRPARSLERRARPGGVAKDGRAIGCDSGLLPRDKAQE